ncbi:phenylacetone monooxygenase [Variibacter gotjawalensis]|uniref:Phenylacetone monooxygenase n=1 Tax=Variibacter gotjawalensis TaxID=1333996 RepID=A0A0S3PNW8_9BRAD|nr:NAD(P)/FAD-dependent oxidoreductase [Variibacter gotjawalensis]NIK47960.1 cation diffusion facilitator CzcD-associated flavoprotein CzcO [Variibacter gotjawalensis]RZS49837.1 cation diffusion facilitator CzcD-associated flavoprotein CzcO [Variibacter gotjawalensis]BAT57666.1 phenylacetone monooxygenase [Variibacter gotjawalensis]
MTAANGRSPSKTYDAVIVGAGFSGLYALHRLRDDLGLKVRVLEMGEEVGGTWYWNRYPGARCDSESYTYTYSFSPELDREWSWSERYPEHPEIRRYLNFVADKLDLKRDIEFGARVTGATFDDAANRWTITTETGETFTAQFFITAVGCLSTTNVPKFKGLDSFRGRWYHTGAWPHEGVDFTGKRVGQIGTGSTGIQAAPVIAEQSKHLTVFQRTPNYSVPARNGPMSEEFKQHLRDNYTAIHDKKRTTTNGHPFDISSTSVLDVSPEDRERILEAAWTEGSLKFRAAFSDTLTNMKANQVISDWLRNKIHQVVKDPEIAERLTPRDHGYATKRPPIDTDYFETYNRDNVTLVDIRKEPIVEITPNGIRTEAREYPLDIIVFATGFDALTGPLFALGIESRDGKALRDVWAAGPQTYLGLQVPDFPNLFTITGPGSPSVLANMPVAIEQHVDWITDCIRHMRDSGKQRIETTEAEAETWGNEVDRAANATLLPMASSSWYLGANVPGKPRRFMPYAGGMAHYAKLCEGIARDGYRGFQFS